MTAVARAITTTGNGKLGRVSTTYAAQQSCPASCIFREQGCYAERGPLWAFTVRPLNQAAAGIGALEVARAEAVAIDEMATVVDRPLRLHTVGDCSTDETARIVSAAAERYTARGGGPSWTYTHGWREVSRASWGSVSVLASCEQAEEVEQAHARGYATAIVTEAHPGPGRYRLDGIDVLPCPEQTKGVTCDRCRLCFKDDFLRERKLTIGFAVHGDYVTKRRAYEALRRER